MPVETQALGAFRIRIWSAGSGAPLVYLHGFESHPGDAPFLSRLAQRRRVIAPEHPGYGDSTGFESLDNMLDLTLYYRQLIESWETGPVDLVGHCLGGMFAAEIAALCPQLVRRLVLVDPFGLWLDDQPLPDPFVMSDKTLSAAKWHDVAAAPNPEPSLAPLSGPGAGDPTLSRKQNLAAATKFLWPIPDVGLRKRLPLIKVPTLVLHGASDGLLPVSYSEALVRFMPDARLHVIPDAGHLPMLEREQEFVTAVEQFLDA